MEKTPPTLVENYRPIDLLNTDFKALAGVLAQRQLSFTPTIFPKID